MASLSVDGADIVYRVAGTGPPLLAPECNFTWAPDFERLMARRFTLVVASPRDFGRSARTGEPYEPDRWATDLLAVSRHLGHRRFLYFGYSFTGAFGPWLARRLARHDAVVAVAAGGFPLLGDYRVTARDVDGQLAGLAEDPTRWAVIERRFDPRAGARFYQELAQLRPDALVDDAPCPLYCFWGDRDHDAVGMVMPSSALAEGLRVRGVPCRQIEGYDHEGLNSRLEVAWPDTERWLLDRARDAGL